jgi:predicted site-specific integrase-resolvase
MTMSYLLPKRLTEREAASYLGIKSQTLQNWRQIGRSTPPFYRIGAKIVYDENELREWMLVRRVAEPETVTA